MKSFSGLPLGLLVVLGTLLAPADADAQAKVFRVGVLAIVPGPTPRTEAFRQSLKDLGYVEGTNLVIEWRWAAGKAERFPDFAADLVRLKMDAIVAGGPQPILAARNATATIPIVMVAAPDPVRSGFVSSLAHPGGNITGLAWEVSPEIFAKQLELLKDTIPQISRVAVLWNPATPGAAPFLEALNAAAPRLRVKLQVVHLQSIDVEAAFATMLKAHPQAMLVAADPVLYTLRQRIVELAARHSLPAIYSFGEIAEAGGFLAYGPSLTDLYRRAATYVDRILKGAKPAELPVEQPARFELVVNLRTARALGLQVPQSVLLRADEVVR